MEFCMQLAREVMLQELRKKPETNVMTSPISMNVLLNMVAAGSKGETLKQFLGSLRAKSIDEVNLISSRIMADLAAPTAETNVSKKCEFGGGPILSCVNGVWADRHFPFKPSYLEITKTVCKADARTLDFSKKKEVVDEVNSWVEERTQGLIKSIVSEDDIRCGTILIMANALYFKGAWEDAFKKSSTRNEDFHLNGKIIQVPYMTKDNKSHFFGSFDGFKLLKLPYRSNQNGARKKFSMYVFLPHERNGLENLIQKLNSNSMLLGFLNSPKLEKVKLEKMWLPKFKFSYGFQATDVIKELGLTLPFEDVEELTGIVEGDRVYVSDILQKCCIEVNEEGTEAAAVTCAIMMCGSSSSLYSPPKPSFVADHPFLFVIKEEFSEFVLFTGAVLDPSLAN